MEKKRNITFLMGILLIFLGTALLHSDELVDSNETVENNETTVVDTTPATRIMPLGDSITYDNNSEDLENPRPSSRRTAYRSHLWYKLQDAGYKADFVGSRVAGEDIVPSFDPDNEGHPAWSSYQLADYVYDYLVINPADIVLLHIGTNDHRTTTIGVEEILDEIDEYERASGLRVHVIVALIIDRESPDPLIGGFNENLKKLIGTRIRNGDYLTLVDMYEGAGLTSRDYFDNTHPNDIGYSKMAEVWAKALLNPYTPGLHAFPYTLVDEYNIEEDSIVVDLAANSVEFLTNIPELGITF